MFTVNIRKLLTDRSGGTAITVAVIFAMVIGFTSLGTEVVQALATQRQMQATADSAAISAANAQAGSGTPSGCGTDCVAEAYALAAAGGFSGGQGGGCTAGTTVYAGAPCDGSHAGDSNYIEVLIKRPFQLRLATLLWGGSFELHGRAVAHVSSSNGTASCTLSLAPNGSGVFMNGNAAVNYKNCAISIASSSSSALSMNGSNDSLSALSLFVGGNYSAGNGTLLMGSPTATTCDSSNAACVTGAPPAINPYSDISAPSCTNGTIKNNIAQPGCFAGSTLSSSSKTISLCPGIYVVTGSISLSGQGAMTSLGSDPSASDYDKNFATDCPGNTASGVTIFLTGSVSLTGHAALTLTPTTTGTYAGMLLDSPTGNFSACAGNCTTNLTGALVFPEGNLKYAGNGNDKGHSCTQIVAWTIEFVGNASLGSDCASLVSNPKQILQPAVLVE